MRFGIHAIGSEGDIRPLLALGAGLRSAGHAVTVAVHSIRAHKYTSICRQLDLDYIDPLYTPQLDTTKLANLADGGEWGRELCEQWWRSNGHEDIIYDTAISLCNLSDVVISHYLSYPTKAATTKTGTPLVSVQLTHEHTPTKYRPPFRTLPNLGERLNPVLWEQVEEMQDKELRGLIDEFWQRKGLPPFGRVVHLYFSDTLNLLAVSPVLCEHQLDWDGLHVVTGWLDLPPQVELWEMSRRLCEFLASGTPPVFMALGSIQEIYPGSNVEKNIELMVQAAVMSGCRALIQTAAQVEDLYPADTYAGESRNIFFVGRVPYSQVFPICAVVVHHGGAGTCHLAIRFGRPSVIVPFTQHHWFLGYELYRVGVAPEPVRRGELTAAQLAKIIRRVLGGQSLRKRSEELGEIMRKENAVAQAVEVIERRFG